MTALPIDAFVSGIGTILRRHRAVVIVAAPGAGKTTRVPPALVDDGRVILLQPRRVAARAIARRIASERGWTLGHDVGWQVRHERRFSAGTRLLVATEGVLTARMQSDPLLSDFRTVIIDEFHERSIHADLGLALARQAMLARDDLRVVVMSATMEAGPVAAFLGDCPVVDVPGRTFALDVTYRPGVAIEDAVIDALPHTRGSILCFLPGAGEIRRAEERLAPRLGVSDVPIRPLYGALDAETQDAALLPHDGPRVILATNIAETTLTVPDVTCVIDSGLQKIARYDADRGIDSLTTERIALDSADQRAGRAGRVQAGAAIRLWDGRDRLRPHREPEIARVDLAGPVLDVMAWGGDPRTFAWFDAPPPGALEGAIDLLLRLGAVSGAGSDVGASTPLASRQPASLSLTPAGRLLQTLPLHPRLGRILIAGRGAPAIALACALLSERHLLPPRHGATSCDLLSTIDQEGSLPDRVRRVARETRAALAGAGGMNLADRITDDDFRRAVLAGYPDRVARRRAAHGDRFLLASGTGARLARESGVHSPEFIVAVDVGGAAAGSEALIRIATGIDRDWIAPASSDVRHELDAGSGVVRAWRVDRYGAVVLAEHHVEADPIAAGEMVAAEYIRRGPTDDDRQLLQRVRFAGLTATFDDLARSAATGCHRLSDVRLITALSADVRRRLDRDAPPSVGIPGGRSVRLQYRDDGAVVAAVRLQAVFGLAASPRLGPGRVPITFELLAPNGRPVQVTSDLQSFWRRGYAEVRKELRARYPKHKWPEPGAW